MQDDKQRWGDGLAIVIGSIAVICGLFAVFLFVNFTGGEGSDSTIETSEQTVDSGAPAISEPAGDDPVAPDPDVDSETTDTTLETTDSASEATEPPSTDETLETTEPLTTEAPAITGDATATSVAPGTADGTPSYPTLDDGSPAPVVAIFDGDTIALSGMVPSEEASDRLETLALANSVVPGASVANFMTINPDVPDGLGVRVIEMQSVRFAVDSSRVETAHALQLDRAVSIMEALPNITVVVIGNADQRGDAEANLDLSADRGESVVAYMASQGIDSSRMSSIGGGSSDPLSLNSDDLALELNRRTEFVFYGLLDEL